MIEIRFTRTGCNAVFGSFSPDDVALVQDDLARHFVGLGCAEMVTQAMPRVEDESPKPAAKSAKTK